MFLRHVATAVGATVLGVLGVGCSTVSGNQPGSSSTFSETEIGSLALVPCTDTVTPSSGNVRCGTLSVPEVHGDPNPNGAKLSLRVFVARRLAGEEKPPVVFLAGGPGQSVGILAATGWTARLAQLFDRDVIMLEQRGCALSVPALDCGINDNGDPGSGDEAVLRACTATYASRGTRIEAFNTLESAHDIEDLRRAIDREKLFVWGTSYGSLLAGTFAREHPTSVAGLVLEASVLGDRTYRSLDRVVLFQSKVEALTAWLKKSCAASERCRTAHPDFDPMAEIETLRARVKAAPGAIGVIPVDSSADLNSLLLRSMYSTPIATLFLRALWAENHGSLATFESTVRPDARPASEFLAGQLDIFRKVSVSANRIVNCYDLERAWTDDGIAKHPYVMSLATEAERQDAENALALDRKSCNALPSPTIDQARFTAPVGGSMPVLFMGGRLDPTTPIEWATSDHAERFTNSALLVSECQGHGVFFGAPECLSSVMRQFFESGPSRLAEDTTCLITRCASGSAAVDRDLFIEDWVTTKVE